MDEIILLKLGEIILKGLNRREFERRLIENVKRRLAPIGEFKIYALQSTVYIEPLSHAETKHTSATDAAAIGPGKAKHMIDAAFEAVKNIFGVAAIARSCACPKDKDAIVKTAAAYLAAATQHVATPAAPQTPATATSTSAVTSPSSTPGITLTTAPQTPATPQTITHTTFKVESKRADKRFPMTSVELSQYVGGELNDLFPHIKPDMHTPDITINIEIRDRAAYIHGQSIRGAGGLPVGTSGRMAGLLSGGIDSPAALYLMAKRGVRILPVHFYSPPYTSVQAKEKAEELTKILEQYCGYMKLTIVPFTKIQEEIRTCCPEALMTVITRRFMLRIAERIARANRCGAIVTGDNLGQVASQTADALAAADECAGIPVFRPLIAYDKIETIELAKKIGTYDTSILPFEDCCTVFTPRRPRTKPRLADIKAAEEKLDIEQLINEALTGL